MHLYILRNKKQEIKSGFISYMGPIWMVNNLLKKPSNHLASIEDGRCQVKWVPHSEGSASGRMPLQHSHLLGPQSSTHVLPGCHCEPLQLEPPETLPPPWRCWKLHPNKCAGGWPFTTICCGAHDRSSHGSFPLFGPLRPDDDTKFHNVLVCFGLWSARMSLEILKH